MNIEDIVAIVAFIAGAAAVSWYSSRRGKQRQEHDTGVHDYQKMLEGRTPDADEISPVRPEPEHPPGPEPSRPQRITDLFSRERPAHSRSGVTGTAPVTMTLIAASVAVALYTGLGSARSLMYPLLISDPDAEGLQSVFSGEVWRLVTPAFIHFSPLHLVFNMIWLWDLGALIERRKGHLFLLQFVLLAAIASNMAQYLMTDSPFFGGMSGVVYGLFGYVWIHGRTNSRFGVILSPQTVTIMLVWFGLCWTGLLGPIANWAHAAGLAIGALWGLQRPEGLQKRE